MGGVWSNVNPIAPVCRLCRRRPHGTGPACSHQTKSRTCTAGTVYRVHADGGPAGSGLRRATRRWPRSG